MPVEPYVCSRTDKECFSRNEAMERAAWWRRVRLARMKHYRCKHCGRYHIGNDRRKPRQR